MKMPAQPEPRICIDCVHHQMDDESTGELFHRCGMPPAASMVDGSPGPCAQVRLDQLRCGPRGTWFQRRRLDEVDMFADVPVPAPKVRQLGRKWNPFR